MSEALEPVVPRPVSDLLDGALDAPGAVGFTMLLVTVRADAWPHVAMISLGEVVAAGEDRILFALWPGSTTTANLAAGRRASLLAVVGGSSYTLRLETMPAGELATPLAGRLACFAGRVAAAARDEAPYAVLESGVRFRLKDPEATLPRWHEVRRGLTRRAAELRT
jgi:hypothetical protein